MLLKRRQGHACSRGISLVELLVGIAVGMFIVAAASVLLTSHLQDNRRLMLETQIQQDLRAAADMVVRELRRGGYWAGSEASVWYPGASGAQANPYSAVAGPAPNATVDQIGFSYTRDFSQSGVNDNNVRDGFEENGFRFASNAIEIKLGTDGAGNPNWQKITDPDTLKVTTFSITLRETPISLDRFCAQACPVGAPNCPPTQQVREYSVLIAGHAANDPTVARKLQATVRPRNEVVTGACPT